jgi:hypothetical protein
MEAVFILGLAGITSIGAYLLGLKGLQLPVHGVHAAVKKMLEYVGAAILFFAVNLTVALAIILAVRGFTGIFLPVYTLTDDIVWLALSLLQGLTFQSWRELSHRGSVRGGGEHYRSVFSHRPGPPEILDEELKDAT